MFTSNAAVAAVSVITTAITINYIATTTTTSPSTAAAAPTTNTTTIDSCYLEVNGTL